MRLSTAEVRELRDLAVKREREVAYWGRQANNLAKRLALKDLEVSELERENERLRLRCFSKCGRCGHPSRWEGEK